MLKIPSRSSPKLLRLKSQLLTVILSLPFQLQTLPQASSFVFSPATPVSASQSNMLISFLPHKIYTCYSLSLERVLPPASYACCSFSSFNYFSSNVITFSKHHHPLKPHHTHPYTPHPHKDTLGLGPPIHDYLWVRH